MRSIFNFMAGVVFLVSFVMYPGCSGGGGGRGSSIDAASDADDSTDQDTRDTSGIISASLPLCKVGISYESNSATHTPAAVQVKDGSSTYVFTIASGTLPEGLTLGESGVISGKTGSPPGRYSFTMRVTDSGNPANTFTQAMSILVVESGSGSQPYSTIQLNPRAYYAHQDSAMCGPTAFYMVLKYFGDNRQGEGPSNADLAEDIPCASMEVVSSTSKVYAYFSSLSKDALPGVDWSEIEDAATTLRKEFQAFYPCIQSNPDAYDNDDSGDETRRTIFQNDLVPFLETNSPVLIHLKRPYGFSGHYIVIVGYDSGTDQVLYLDPNDTQFDPRDDGYDPDSLDWKEVVRSVALNALVGEAWYAKSGYLDAYWDGKWIGFTH